MAINKKPERWARIFIDGEKTVYKISSHGRILSEHGGSPVIRKGYNHKGYRRFTICHNGVQKGYLIHTLVGLYFIKNPKPRKYKIVNHKFGVKDDNYYEHLEWTDDAGNVQHAFEIGIKVAVHGERCGKSKITNQDAKDILLSSLTTQELCKKYNISKSAIRRIKRGEGWSKVTGKSGNSGGSFKLKAEEVISIFMSDLPNSELAKKYGVKEGRIYDIKKGIRWSEVTKEYGHPR